jgi:hypothetical protein
MEGAAYHASKSMLAKPTESWTGKASSFLVSVKLPTTKVATTSSAGTDSSKTSSEAKAGLYRFKVLTSNKKKRAMTLRSSPNSSPKGLDYDTQP